MGAPNQMVEINKKLKPNQTQEQNTVGRVVGLQRMVEEGPEHVECAPRSMEKWLIVDSNKRPKRRQKRT